MRNQQYQPTHRLQYVYENQYGPNNYYKYQSIYRYQPTHRFQYVYEPQHAYENQYGPNDYLPTPTPVFTI